MAYFLPHRSWSDSKAQQQSYPWPMTHAALEPSSGHAYVPAVSSYACTPQVEDCFDAAYELVRLSLLTSLCQAGTLRLVSMPAHYSEMYELDWSDLGSQTFQWPSPCTACDSFATGLTECRDALSSKRQRCEFLSENRVLGAGCSARLG